MSDVINTLDSLSAWAGNYKLQVRAVKYRGSTFYVRELGDEELPAWEEAIKAVSKEGETEPHKSRPLVALCLCDADGTPLVKGGDATALPSLPLGLLKFLFAAAISVNGGGESITKLEKKSEPTPISGVGTNSRGKGVTVIPAE